MNTRLAFIMAGGSGERFWPVSTKTNPKQFLNLADPRKSLLQQAVNRAAECVSLENTHISTTKILAEKSLEVCSNLKNHQVIAEPNKRNTAGCLVWMMATIIARNPNTWATTTVAVLTADQKIEPLKSFIETVQLAFETAEETGSLVTIGIKPTRPDTGFGYIELGETNSQAIQVKKFKEKPDLDTAKHYLATENYLWNSGMFFFTVPTLLAEMERTQPEMAKIARQISGHLAANEYEKAEQAFDQLESISFDYAVMEKAERVMVVPATFDWDDLGSWDSVARAQMADQNGNVCVGSARLIDSHNNVIYSTAENPEINILGVENLVIVSHNGKLLICPKDRAQEVKKFLQEPV